MTVFEAITVFTGIGLWSVGLVWAISARNNNRTVVEVKGRRFSG